MTSAREHLGRTWYETDGGRSSVDGVRLYLGMHIRTNLLRPNAMTFWDFDGDNATACAQRSLLRVFARIVHGLLGNPKTAEGAQAVLEWDSKERMRRPEHMWLHVLLSPPKEDLDVESMTRDCLDVVIASDNKAYTRLGSSGKTLTNKSINRMWTESDFVLAVDQWSALASTYTVSATDAPPGANSLQCCPSDVFSPGNAELGSRWDSGTGTLRLCGGGHVPMRRSDFESRILFRKYLPWYQESQLNIPTHVEDGTRARALLRQASAVPTGEMHDTQSAWEKLMARAAAARAEGLEDYAEWATAEVAHSMDGSQACYVPECEHVINTHKMKPFEEVPTSDAELSPFATWVTHFMMQAECYGWVYKQHQLLLLLFMGGLDCYREAQSGSIHFSVILAGPPTASKSFCFTLIERLLIKGTVETATRRTENSFTYSDDQGSRICVDHELSKDFFGDVQSRRMGGTARTGQTKEILTSHKATVEACYCDEFGNRQKTRTESRAQLAYFAATNDWSTGGGCDKALVSRFYVVFPTLGKVKNKPLADLMQHDRNPTEHDKLGFEKWQAWSHNMQKMVYWAMKLIHIGAIPDVDQTAVNMVISQFVKAWPTAGGNPRGFERIVLLTRIQAIITAVHMHYCATDAPRRGEVPQVVHFREMIPNMVVTAEQAKFSLAMLQSEFVNPAERSILEALQRCNLVPDMDNGGANYLVPVNVESTKQLIDEVMMHCDSDTTPDAVQQFLNLQAERRIRSHPFTRSPMSKHGVAECKELPKKVFYALRGRGIHASMIVNPCDTDQSVEDALLHRCSVGPPGKEITAMTVPGFPHLLRTRRVEHEARPYVRDCLFLPQSVRAILGKPADELLSQDHRRHPKQVVDVPVEVMAREARGGKPMPTRRPGGIVYPDAYLQEVGAMRTPFDFATGDLTDEQYESIKRKLPAECFLSTKKAKT